jgi:hypothetical protein
MCCSLERLAPIAALASVFAVFMQGVHNIHFPDRRRAAVFAYRIRYD